MFTTETETLLLPDVLDREQRTLVVAHYQRVAPLLVKQFGPIPLIAGFTRELNSGKSVFESAIQRPVPESIPTVEVTTTGQTARYVALAENSLLWQVHRRAIEFLSWAPVPGDPAAVAFARILMNPAGTATETMMKEAAAEMRALLKADGIDCIALLGGLGGISLWIPFGDRPAYPPVRAWLHQITSEAERRNPSLFSVEAPVSERGNRVHVAVSSNAPGRYSALPYCLRAFDDLPMVTPISWNELPQMWSGETTAATFGQRLARVGDVFASEVARIGAQPSATVLAKPAPLFALAFEPMGLEPRGRILQAAMAILADGKPRSADELCDEAIQRGLVPRTTSRKYFYTALTEYIARAKGHDRKPVIVQDTDRRFRSNHPADDWPTPKTPLPKPHPAKDAEAIATKLRATSTGEDPTAFEVAVCEAFAALGFRATHIGGKLAPDGYIDAPLGSLGYRVMLECKTAHGVVTQPNAVEAGKYREAFHADFGALIGPAFGEWVALGSELATHHISAFTVDDVIALLEAGSDPFELKPLFASGFASERIVDLIWERGHGFAKRVAVVCDIIASIGWKEQYAAAAADRPAESPLLTEDAAMMLVDEALFDVHGSQQPCTRDQIKAAFAYLTTPLNAQAEWANPERTAIVVRRAALDLE